MKIRVDFPCIWSMVRQLRSGISELLADCDAEIVHAVSLAASELSENVVKYGEPENENDTGMVEVDKGSDVVTITTHNRTRDSTNVAEIQGAIAALDECDDAEVIYMRRMEQMLLATDPEAIEEGRSQLGLVRVAAEAGFALRCNYADGLLTVTASRKL